MHRSVAILQGESRLHECLVGNQVVNVLWVQLEELCLRKQCVFWAPGKLGPMCVGHQLAERAFVVVVPRPGPVMLDCNCIVLGRCDRDMVGSDPPPTLWHRRPQLPHPLSVHPCNRGWRFTS